MRSYLQGKSLKRQTVFNINQRQFCDNHPGSYGWTFAGVNPDGLIIWAKDGALMQRHPAQDCWLLFWMDCWQPIDKHISQLSEELETIKTQIELEIAMEEFSATVETMAA